MRSASRAPYEFRPAVLDDVAPPNLYTLRGPRRAGKSTALKQTVQRLLTEGVAPQRICYLALDTVSHERELVRAIEAALMLFPEQTGPRYFLLDEITSVPAWYRGMKWLRDNTDASLACVIATGSSSADIDEGTTFLAGRRGTATGLDRVLLPMTFAQFLLHIGLWRIPAPPALQLEDLLEPAGRRLLRDAMVHLGDLVDGFNAYLAVGGFPRAVADYRETAEVSDSFCRDLWDVIRSDLSSGGVRRPEIAVRLLERVSASLSGPMVWSKLSEDLGVMRPTVQDWLGELASAYLLLLLFQETSGVPDTKKQRKVYPADPLLASLPSRMWAGVAAPDPSKVAEAAIAMALFRSVEGSPIDDFHRPNHLYWFRSSRGTEVDFIVQPGHVGVESKYTDRPLEKVRAALERFDRAAILTHAALDLDRTIPAVPAALFCWMLEQT